MSGLKLKLPRLGFGTWQLSPEECKNAVLHAIETGYRLIDTAQAYKNEEAVGEALAEETIDRKELIIATKVFVFSLWYKCAKKSTYKSLEKLKLDNVDMLYVHWPGMTYKASSTMKAFNELVEEGKVKHICVSNFNVKKIEEAQKYAKYPIAANQIECHPLLQQNRMREYQKEKGIYLIAYSPLARGNVFSVPEIKKVAEKHNVTPAQVSLAWLMSKGDIPIPKATSKAHIEDNFKSLKLQLDAEDIQMIDNIKEEKRLLNPPVIKPKWDE